MDLVMVHSDLKHALQGLFDDAGESFGLLELRLRAENLLAVVQRLKGEFGFELFLDVTAIDHAERSPRFEVVYHFYSRPLNARIRLKVAAPGSEPAVPTLTPLYGSARYMEREAHDMYGILFTGNADLRPILLYEGFVGHPLRKDYPMEAEQPIVDYRQ
jgi:NADH-quinone oxidoreductase subunit C